LPPITRIQGNNHHILGVFSSPQRKVEEGLEYLRIGFKEKNEAILLVTDELTKDEVRNEIIKKWKISSNELVDLERDGIINIKSSKIYYFSTKIIDCYESVKQYSDIINKAIEKGKKGLRTFADTKIFFERGYEKYIIEIEKSYSPSYDFPLTVICAYDLDDFEKLDQQSRKILVDHHNLHITNNIFRNIFDESCFNLGMIGHICMYYENESQSSSSFVTVTKNTILQYIDEGLRQNQICVYLSMNNLEKDYPKTILSEIPNLKKNEEKNFMIIKNSDDYYISAVCDNLKPFEDLKRQIFEKAILNNKKAVRIVCDIPDFLFRNKHFDQCIALEEWWDQTIEEMNKRHGLNISLLCLYNSNNFQNTPFKYHISRINDNHSNICDSDGIVHSKFDSLIGGGKRKSENRGGIER
jgi:MEDS: MEthanogen/methylotroph, DcmR Sensory domain